MRIPRQLSHPPIARVGAYPGRDRGRKAWYSVWICDCVSFSSDAHSVPLAALRKLGHQWRGANYLPKVVDLWRSPRSPEVTIFETADEIAYAESTGGIFVSIGTVVPEL